MNIHTSYYSKVRMLPKENTILVQVSNTVPTWFREEYYKLSKDLSPEWGIINAYKCDNISRDCFMSKYRDYLDKHFDKNEILLELSRLAQACNVENVILLCYEKDAESCHRTELGKWLGDFYLGEL